MAVNPGRNGAGRQGPTPRPPSNPGRQGAGRQGQDPKYTGNKQIAAPPPPPSGYGSGSGGGGYSGYGYGYGGGGGGGGGGGSSTHTTTNLSSRAEARAVLYAGLQTVLGRKPQKSEVDAYYKALNVYEKKHPTVTTSSGDTTTQTGGVSSTMGAQFTQDWVNQDADLKAEKGSYDIASKYMNAFIQAIQGPVNL